MTTPPYVLTFANLFAGRTDAYGLGKGAVERATEKAPVDWLRLYSAHLQGKGSGLGIFPLLDDGTCWFAAIDLDEPDFEFARELQEYLPGQTWIERSRSGNVHVWAFFERPCEAWVARALMKGALEALGRPNVEVFPKQDRLLPGMLGNYINLPLHGFDRPILSAPMEGTPYDTETFVMKAAAAKIDPADWKARALALGIRPPEEREPASEFGERAALHPCAVYIMEGIQNGERPLVEGRRSVVLFSLAKMLLNWRDLSQQEALTLLNETNEASAPPLPRREVNRIFGNALRGRFTSTGCDDPLMADYIAPDCPIAHG